MVDRPKILTGDMLKMRVRWMKSLATWYSEHAAQYRSCIFEGLLERLDTEWIPRSLIVRFWYEPTGRPEKDFEYPTGDRLVRFETPADAAWASVAKLSEGTTLEIPGHDTIYVGDQTGVIEEVNSHFSPVGIGWRCKYGSVYAVPGVGQGGSRALVSSDAPLFPDLDSAIFAWTGTYIHWSPAGDNKLTVVLPEFACRVSGLRLGRLETDVIVEPGPSPPNSVVGQFFARGPEGPGITGQFEGPPGTHVASVGFAPEIFEVRVFDQQTRRLLDGRVFRRDSAYGNQGVAWKERADDLRAAILSGEGEYLEFKQDWNGENPRRFKEAVTAFSNSPVGGTIIFGIKNDPIEILGVPDQWNLDKWTLTLYSSVRDSINPAPKINVTEEFLPERVIIAQIEAGSKTPYSLRNRGVLVRAGSSNRVPEQHELVELVKRGSS